MSGRRMWSISTKRFSGDSRSGSGYRGAYSNRGGADELEDIAVVSNADPGQVKYGSGLTTANGPRVVPGIITSQKVTNKRMSLTASRVGSSSPHCVDRATMEILKGKSLSGQSLMDMMSSKISLGSKKRLSRESFSASYIHRANAASELDVSRKTREARKKDIKNRFVKMDKWESSTSSSERVGCRWTFVFDPAGRLCYYWTFVVSLAFLYNLWVIIYRFAFNEICSENIIMWFCLDYFADFIYISDIIFHFRTGYLEDGVLQTDSRKLRDHYMNSTTFYVDCLCLLPLDFLYLSIGFKSVLRCFRLVKIYKFWNFLDRTERHTNSPNLFRSISLIHYLLVIFHWNACVFNLIYGKYNNYDSYIVRWLAHGDASCPSDEEVAITTTPAGKEPQSPTASPTAQLREKDVPEYLEALYWCTLTLTTVGGHPKPCTKYDFAYQICQLLFGMMLFATVLGHIANIVTNVSAARKEFQAKLDGVKTYMRLRRVPSHIQAKVIKWFDYLWLTQKCSDEEKAVSCLPDKLKAEIAIHVHLDTLKRVEIFQNTEAGFLCELVLRLRPVLFSPGDYICRKGEVGKEMYIVNRGRLQVVADNGKTMLATLKAGSYFGEISILNMGTAGNRRTASVRSVGYSDLFVLSKKDMWDVLKEYPAARVRLEAIAAKRLEKYKKAPLEKAAMARSSSTPGLVESSGRITLEDMWLPEAICSPNKQPNNLFGKRFFEGQSLQQSPSLRNPVSKTEPDRNFIDCALSDSPSSRHSHSTDEEKPRPDSERPIQSTRSGTTASVASYDSGDKRSTITSPSNLMSPLPSPNYATGTVAYSLPVPPQTEVPTSDHALSVASLSGVARLTRTSQRDSPQGSLVLEIRRLRENLDTLVSENATMSMKLSHQQWEVESRLHHIELQVCGGHSSTASSNEDNERNKESII